MAENGNHDEEIPPTIKVPNIPDWTGTLTEDLEDFPKAQRRIYFALSKIEQATKFAIAHMLLLYEHARVLEARIARLERIERRERQDRKLNKWQWSLIRWPAVICLSAFLGAAMKKLIDHLWP